MLARSQRLAAVVAALFASAGLGCAEPVDSGDPERSFSLEAVQVGVVFDAPVAAGDPPRLLAAEESTPLDLEDEDGDGIYRGAVQALDADANANEARVELRVAPPF